MTPSYERQVGLPGHSLYPTSTYVRDYFNKIYPYSLSPNCEQRVPFRSAIIWSRRNSGRMAIYPKANHYAQNGAPNASPPQPINIEAWTEEATQSLNAVSLGSAGVVPGTSETLAIDLDEPIPHKQDGVSGNTRRADDASSGYRPRREPLRRDSLKRREALLKGKEGSRRRTRWENGSYHTWST